MKFICCLLLVVMGCPLSSNADGVFAPTVLKLDAPPVIRYDFNGTPLNIPVTISGHEAGLILSVFTKDMATGISGIVNGYLGWHYVNKIDTCIYLSALKSVNKDVTINMNWSGLDLDGNPVPAGTYTYYVWAFDNQGSSETALECIWDEQLFDLVTAVLEKDTDGLPLANPIWYRADMRWILGNDPHNYALKDSCIISLADGWQYIGEPLIDPQDFSCQYMAVRNTAEKKASIQKIKWVSYGTAEIQTGWGVENGFAAMFDTAGGGSAGVVTDGDYIFTTDENSRTSDEPDAGFYIYDFDGRLVDTIDLSPWWSSQRDYEGGGQMNGGPDNFFARNGFVFLNGHNSCIVQMVSPARFLETGDVSDFFVWTNDNGDFFFDQNFEDTPTRTWICNDYNVGPFKTSISADRNLFCMINLDNLGAISFGLAAPDGTGLGYFAFAGETAGRKAGKIIIDGETPFDGIYSDNQNVSSLRWPDGRVYPKGVYYYGHDSIKGVITNDSTTATGHETPAAFTLSRNSPNPFNPSTTIRFSLAGEARVTLDVFAVSGAKIATLAEGSMSAGEHEVVWDASGFPSGVYFCRLRAAGNEKTMKMMLVK